MVFCCYGIISAEQALIVLSKIHKLLFFCKFFSFFFMKAKSSSKPLNFYLFIFFVFLMRIKLFRLEQDSMQYALSQRLILLKSALLIISL